MPKLGLLLILTLPLALSAPGAPQANVLDDLARATARAGSGGADGLRRLDDVPAGTARFRQSVRARVLDEGFDGLDDAARRALLMRRIDAIPGIEDGLRRQLRALPAADQEIALAVGRGGEVLREAIGDTATRARILREGGVPTVAAIGTFGPDAARQAMELQVALGAADAIRVAPGVPRPRLEDFGRALQHFGEGSWRFWRTHVMPNWKLLAGSGLLAAYLADPEAFQDAAGNLTEHAVAEFTRLGIRVAEGAGAGMARGAMEVVAGYDLRAWLLLALGVLICSLAFRRVRHYALAPVRWLNRAPGSGPAT